ncbi:MAG TPA: alpha/beta hydrolase [Candidatus Dormibacteraeota bacterium]|nr:alpha/beta hydrolase [Candidatus Dormibacteraeota bacterium]
MTIAAPPLPDGATALELHITSGRIAACSFGSSDAPLILCVHGLSANQRSYDVIAPRLAAQGRRVVAIDLRGRGYSEVTPPGTYGWDAHAADVLEIATALDAPMFDLVGHSMGGYVSMIAAARQPERIRRLVLIDIAGRPEPDSTPPIVAAVERLGVVQPSVDAYIAKIRATAAIDVWSEKWERYFAYELRETEGGVVSRTSRDAVVEDMSHGASHDIETVWPLLRMPTLLVRAGRPILPGLGYVVSAADRDRFVKTAPDARAVDIDANHYGVVMHEDTVRALEAFLR